MNESGYSLSDIQAATNGSGLGGFGSEGLWIFALLILMFGGGGFGFGGAANAVSQADLQRAIDLNSIQGGQRDIEARVQEIGAETITATKDAAYNNLSEIRDNGALISAGFANMQNCCCETNRNIDAVRYDMANFTAATQAAVHAEGEQTRAMIQQNKIESLQQQVNQLSMQQALCGVPKISTYAWGTYPYNAGCGCSGNI